MQDAFVLPVRKTVQQMTALRSLALPAEQFYSLAF